MKRNFFRLVGPLVLTTFLTGCASISVEPESQSDTKQAPKKVYVEAFDTKGEFNVDREDAELVEFKKNLQAMMITGITVDLTKRLVPATATKTDAHYPHEHAWLIRGEFIRVNQGSRFLRGAIGFGAGGTKLETRVYVYDLSDGLDNKPFLVFSTTGGSNAEPGAITAIATDPLTIAIEAVASSGGGIAHGLTEDTKRTAREVTAELSDYMYQRGWIYDDQWVKPKIYSN